MTSSSYRAMPAEYVKDQLKCLNEISLLITAIARCEYAVSCALSATGASDSTRISLNDWKMQRRTLENQRDCLLQNLSESPVNIKGRSILID